MNGNSYGSGYAPPTSRGMGAILTMIEFDTERGDVVERKVLRKDVIGTIGEGIDFDGEHQQELDDND